ncbi:MAG: hypothetical protein HC849_00400 [Oscillatoriales cyanobacterium RU_3_3]|nr:hypothetical protein [Microcoleus sp. SU_5_6]NJM58994.1 hypothetical protein [Oscillatoriales cyanobacterium RU_3_3]
MSDRRTEKQVLKPDLVAEIAIPTTYRNKYSHDRVSEARSTDDRPLLTNCRLRSLPHVSAEVLHYLNSGKKDVCPTQKIKH